MAKLHTLDEIAQLVALAEAKHEELLQELMEEASLADRELQMELGLYGRLTKTLDWLGSIQDAVVLDSSVPAIKLASHVQVTLFDSYIKV